MVASLYDTLGRQEGRVRRGDQEGVPQARRAVPPGQESGRRIGGGDASRKCRTRTTFSPIRRSGRSTTASARRTDVPGPARAASTSAAAATSRSTTSATSAICSAGSSAAGPVAARARAGGGAARRATSRSTSELSFEDSLRGIETKIPVEVTTACRECGGTGAEPGTSPVICPECHGRGVVSREPGDVRALASRVRAAGATARWSRSRAGSATARAASGGRSGTR